MRIVKRLPVVTLAAIMLFGSSTAAQGAPGSDIYLVSFRMSRGQVTFGDAVNITDRDGYDNQPSFLPDSRSLLYTSNRDGQTDIYQYFVRTKATKQITQTIPESEYSPLVTPAGDAFSVIRVEADSTQRLWQFDLDGRNPRLLFTDIRPVGYHAWGNDHMVALYVLSDSATPSTLQLGDTRSGRARIIAYRVGRSLHKIPGKDAVSFTHRVPDFWIKQLDIETGAVRPLIELLEGNEFYTWMPDGTAVMGQGSKIYRWDPNTEVGWEEFADLAEAGVSGISRIAVSPDGAWLAVVGGR